MRIVFMGTPEFSVPCLEVLRASGHDLVAVYTQPARRAGRGKAPRPTPVARAAEAAGIPVKTPVNFRKDQALAELAALAPEAIFVVAYGLLLPKTVLALPAYGCWNVHASLLPRWRGAAPIERAILAGDRETGVGIMKMTAGLDEGPVLLERRTAIEDQETGGELHARLTHLGAEALSTALPLIMSAEARPEPQSVSGLTYAAKIEKSESRIDWTKPAELIIRQIRAFNPHPGAWCFDDQGRRLKVLAADLTERGKTPGKPGELLGDKLWISCGQQSITVTHLQPDSKKPMPSEAYLLGRQHPKGSVFS